MITRAEADRERGRLWHLLAITPLSAEKRCEEIRAAYSLAACLSTRLRRAEEMGIELYPCSTCTAMEEPAR